MTTQAERTERAEHGRQVLEAAARESERIEQVLTQSREVRSRALPLLKRAGYLR